MKIKPIIKSIINTFPVKYKAIIKSLPVIHKMFMKGSGGTFSARYCYSAWLRHLSYVYINGLSTEPDTIAEFGPGDSIGIGLAALLSGANKFYAFDIVEYANLKKNLEILDELINLYLKREKIPDNNEFPEIKPYLKSYKFPKHILSEKRLNNTLKKERIENIRTALLNKKSHSSKGIQISYIVPWHDSNIIKNKSIDMIYSQAVLEHVDDLSNTYEKFYQWLKPNGFMSHQIDFRCHGTAKDWNGHWSYSDFTWRLIRGNRAYLINRYPHSTHIKLLRKCGFEIICDIKMNNFSGIKRNKLASNFLYLTDDDLITSGAFIQSIKK